MSYPALLAFITLIVSIAGVVHGQNWEEFQRKHVTGTSRIPIDDAEDCYSRVKPEYADRPLNSLIFANWISVVSDFRSEKSEQWSKNKRTICTVSNKNGTRSAAVCYRSKYRVKVEQQDGVFVPVHFIEVDTNSDCYLLNAAEGTASQLLPLSILFHILYLLEFGLK